MQVAQDHKRAVFRVEMTPKQVADSKELEVVALAWFGAPRDALERIPQTAASAQGSKRSVASDPKQPRLGVLDRMKLTATPKRVREAVLKEILGQGSVADHLCQKAAEPNFAAQEQTLDDLPTRRRFRLARTALQAVAGRQRLDVLGALPHLRIQVPVEGRT